jgi:aryl-alcohol dehydrogenase-like predicted oxidoreductase
MSISRRSFLESAAVGISASVGVLSAREATLGATISKDPLAVVPLGKHLRVTRIGLGFGMRGWNRESNLSRRGIDHAERVIRHAYEKGIRLFDHADLYGSHQFFARALKDKPRDSYCVVTKIWFHPRGLPEDDRPDADVVVKRFLKELNTDYIDLVQMHCMMRPDWPTLMERQMEILERLKQKGIIRAHGVSIHGLAPLQAAVGHHWVDVVHVRINPFGEKMDAPAEQVAPVVEKIHSSGTGVIGMKIVGEGAFSKDKEKLDSSIQYVLGLGTVDAMIVGFETEEDIDDFIARVEKALTVVAARS